MAMMIRVAIPALSGLVAGPLLAAALPFAAVPAAIAAEPAVLSAPALTPPVLTPSARLAQADGGEVPTPPGARPEPGPALPDGPPSLEDDHEPADDALPPDAFAVPDPALPDSGDQTLDDLYQRLAQAKSAAEAHPFEQRILKRLVATGSATLDLMVGWSTTAAAAKRYPVSLDLLDQILLQKPDYAEGYNRRATIYYMQDEYNRALADIDRALALEPRHFGALSGLALIMRELDEDARALEIYRRLEVLHPNLPDVRKAIDELTLAVDGRPI